MKKEERTLRILEVLNNKVRLKILSKLNSSEGSRIRFKEFYNDVFDSKISKIDLFFHLRTLVMHNLITNDSHLEKADFGITKLGVDVMHALKEQKHVETVVSV